MVIVNGGYFLKQY